MTTNATPIAKLSDPPMRLAPSASSYTSGLVSAIPGPVLAIRMQVIEQILDERNPRRIDTTIGEQQHLPSQLPVACSKRSPTILPWHLCELKVTTSSNRNIHWQLGTKTLISPRAVHHERHL